MSQFNLQRVCVCVRARARVFYPYTVYTIHIHILFFLYSFICVLYVSYINKVSIYLSIYLMKFYISDTPWTSHQPCNMAPLDGATGPCFRRWGEVGCVRAGAG